jgi:hypothetical protein
MPEYVYVIINAVLALTVLGGVIGLLVWSVATQHRHAGCEDVRLRLRRRRISVSLAPLPPLQDERAAQEVVLG